MGMRGSPPPPTHTITHMCSPWPYKNRAMARVGSADDDDAWEPDHIAACCAALLGPGPTASHGSGGGGTLAPMADLAVSGLIRYAADAAPPGTPVGTGVQLCGGRPQLLPPPGPLAAWDPLSSNPHVQGSNLFARLDTLMQARAAPLWPASERTLGGTHRSAPNMRMPCPASLPASIPEHIRGQE